MLPIDTLLYVVTFLDVWDILRVRQISKEWRDCIDNSSFLWNSIYSRYWPQSRLVDRPKDFIIPHFRAIYLLRCLLKRRRKDGGIGFIVNLSLPVPVKFDRWRRKVIKWTKQTRGNVDIETVTRRYIPHDFINSIEGPCELREHSKMHHYFCIWTTYTYHILNKLGVVIPDAVKEAYFNKGTDSSPALLLLDVKTQLWDNIHNCLAKRWIQYDVQMREIILPSANLYDLQAIRRMGQRLTERKVPRDMVGHLGDGVDLQFLYRALEFGVSIELTSRDPINYIVFIDEADVKISNYGRVKIRNVSTHLDALRVWNKLTSKLDKLYNLIDSQESK